jgi:hypothetical protein
MRRQAVNSRRKLHLASSLESSLVAVMSHPGSYQLSLEATQIEQLLSIQWLLGGETISHLTCTHLLHQDIVIEQRMTMR